MAYPADQDPFISHRAGTLEHWLLQLHKQPDILEWVTHHWQQEWHRLAQAKNRLLRVRGPLSAVIATLQDLGYQGMGPGSWISPDGQHWEADFGGDSFDLTLFSDHLRRHLDLLCWEKAETHEGGSGLRQGPINMDDIRKFLGSMEHRERGIARAAIQGGLWLEQRRHQAGFASSPLCPRCHKEPEDVFHLLWVCLANLDLEDPRSSTQTTWRPEPRSSSTQTQGCGPEAW